MLTVLENNPPGQHMKLIQQRQSCLHIYSLKASVVHYESMSVLITSTSSYRKDPVRLGSLIISPCSYQTLSTDGKITFCPAQENRNNSIRVFFFFFLSKFYQQKEEMRTVSQLRDLKKIEIKQKSFNLVSSSS